MKTYNLGVLGLGEGRSILSAAQSSPRWQVVNICDINENACRERKEEFSLSRYTTRYEDMLNDPSIDTIAIYTPNEFHAQNCIDAFTAGKHVICTKPLFDNLKDALKVKEAAQKAQRQLLVGQSSRFFAPMLLQRKDYLSGKIGEVYSVEAHYHADHRGSYKRKNLSLYKPLFGGLSHAVDLVRWYLGPIDEVFGYSIISPIGKELGLANADSMHFVLRSKDGRIGRASGCYSTPSPCGKRESQVTCMLHGTQGTTHADYPELRYSTHFVEEGEVVHDLEDQYDYYFRFSGRSYHAGEFQNYIEYFADCLDNGITAEPDIYEGIETVAIMVAMEESSRTGNPVKIDPSYSTLG